jgi:hypothetical protein
LGSFGGEQIVEIDGGFGGADGGDSLVIAGAGEAVELDTIFEADWDAFGFGELHEGFDAVAVAAFGDDDAVKRAAGGESFFDCVKTC